MSDAMKGRGPWVSAIRPGFVADESASLIWGAIPDETKAKPVLLFGEPVGVTTR